MKILLYIPCWHRPELVAMFIDNMECTGCDYAEIIPYFVLSPEDEDEKELTQITGGYNRTYTTNISFGRKKNEGLMRALSLEWDYVMEFNSDNVYTPLLWEYHKKYFDESNPFFGFKSVYVYEPYLNRAVYLESYHIGLRDEITAMGWGRCIRRDVVEKCFPLWIDEAPFGMDGQSDERITSMGYDCTVIETGEDPVVCGIAATVCLTGWDQWSDIGVPANVDFVREAFGLCPAVCFDLGDFDSFHSTILKVSSDMNKPAAFDLINEAYRLQTGEKRYSSYDSYKNVVSRKHKSK